MHTETHMHTCPSPCTPMCTHTAISECAPIIPLFLHTKISACTTIYLHTSLPTYLPTYLYTNTRARCHAYRVIVDRIKDEGLAGLLHYGKLFGDIKEVPAVMLEFVLCVFAVCVCCGCLLWVFVVSVCFFLFCECLFVLFGCSLPCLSSCSGRHLCPLLGPRARMSTLKAYVFRDIPRIGFQGQQHAYVK